MALRMLLLLLLLLPDEEAFIPRQLNGGEPLRGMPCCCCSRLSGTCKVLFDRAPASTVDDTALTTEKDDEDVDEEEPICTFGGDEDGEDKAE